MDEAPSTIASDAVAVGRVALANEVRRLIESVVTNQAPASELAAASRAIAAVADQLGSHVREPHPPRHPTSPSADPADYFPFDCVLGRFNPVAVPVVVEWQEPLAIGRVRYAKPYEGPPGCVHGAVIAATFDQVFNVANLMQGTPGPTRRLEIRYRKPTPLGRDLRFEGWQERVEGREVHVAGRLVAGDVVTVEASGTFVQIPPERVMKLLG
jgi:acyl-coenzyme A thioesterase PaaI-like protein